MGTGFLQIDGLTKYFGDHLVLDRVTLSVARHEVLCLIGASGSGKSTLLRCINRLIEPDWGEIRLEGVPITDAGFGKTGLQRRVGIVFQSYNLFPHLSVLDNITLAPRKVLRQSRAEAEARARPWRCSAWTALPSRIPSSFRAGSSSAWRWSGRWPATPMSCCWTR